MSKASQPNDKIIEEIKAKARNNILSKKNLIEVLATRNIRDAFFYFPKPPIATGASQDSSLAFLNNDLTLDLSINTEYFKYVAVQRNPLEKASDNIFQGITNLLNV